MTYDGVDQYALLNLLMDR